MIGNTVEQDETWTVATLKEYAKTCGLPVLVVGIASVCVGVTTCATSCPKIVNLRVVASMSDAHVVQIWCP